MLIGQPQTEENSRGERQILDERNGRKKAHPPSPGYGQGKRIKAETKCGAGPTDFFAQRSQRKTGIALEVIAIQGHAVGLESVDRGQSG
jgi:hypothetical protein